MTQIYDWTPEILQKVRETCVWCAEEKSNVREHIINHKIAVDHLCKKYPNFPRKKYEKIKLTFTDEEYLKLRNTAKKKNLPNETIIKFDIYFDHAFNLACVYAVNGSWGCSWNYFGFESNVLSYLELAYYIQWVKANSSKLQVDYSEIKYESVLNQSISWPDTALTRLYICKKEKNLE
jgi:hypothetical protein